MSAPGQVKTVVYRRPDGQLVDANGTPIEMSQIGVLPTYSVKYNTPDGREVWPDGRLVNPEDGGHPITPESRVAEQANAGLAGPETVLSPGERAYAAMGLLDEIEGDIADLPPEEQEHIREQARQHTEAEAASGNAAMRMAPARTPRLDAATLARLQAEMDAEEEEQANQDTPTAPESPAPESPAPAEAAPAETPEEEAAKSTKKSK